MRSASLRTFVVLCFALPCTRAVSEESKAFPEQLRVFSVQMPVTGDLDANLDAIRAGLHAADDADARVAVFPETALSGFEAEDIATLDWDAHAAAMETIAATAAEHDLYVVYGTATPSPNGKPYNSAVIVGPDGEEVYRYHKSFPEPWFTPGERLALFEIDGVPSTVIVCHDNRFPELVRIPVLAGARICFYISYEINTVAGAKMKRENYKAQSIARAAENGIWFVQSNGYGPVGGDRLSMGESRIVSPRGVVAAQAPALEYATIQFDIVPKDAHRGNALEGLEGKLLADWWEAGVDQLTAVQAAIDTPTRDKPRGNNRLRLALMQAVPVKWDIERNFETFLRYLDQAHDADIFITPECWLDGYAAPDEDSTPERLRTVAQDLETSPYLERVAREARERSMWICFGFSSIENGALYNAAGLWNHRGELVGMYHKTHLQTHDLQYAPGEGLPVWETDWGPVGTMICADRRWPETARALRLQGARLILNPTYGMWHYDNEWWLRTRGYENQAFVAFAHPQVSFVVGPWGGLRAKRVDTPGVMLCDIDLGEARDDNHLRDRRPEIYDAITK